MLQHIPMTVQSNGRLYTDSRQRDEIGIETTYGYLTPVEVGVVKADRSPEWEGIVGQYATFRQTLGSDGEIRIPLVIRRELDITEGDDLRVTVKNVSD